MSFCKDFISFLIEICYRSEKVKKIGHSNERKIIINTFYILHSYNLSFYPKPLHPQINKFLVLLVLSILIFYQKFSETQNGHITFCETSIKKWRLSKMLVSGWYLLNWCISLWVEASFRITWQLPTLLHCQQMAQVKKHMRPQGHNVYLPTSKIPNHHLLWLKVCKNVI